MTGLGFLEFEFGFSQDLRVNENGLGNFITLKTNSVDIDTI